jgi:hypothetical protein
VSDRRFLFLVSVFLLACGGKSPPAGPPPRDFGKEAQGQFATVEEEMNATYQKILKDYASDPLFIFKFKVAQKAWLEYRHAYLDALFPEDKRDPMCANSVLTMLTRQRISELKEWADGVDDAENCAGSKHKKPKPTPSGETGKK